MARSSDIPGPGELVGREREQARLGTFLAGVAAGRGGALAITGDPGIGKTALLDHARRTGGTARVVEATGAEAERDLPFGTLQALLRPLLDGARALPAVQRRALEGALAVGPPAPADRLVVHAAVLGLVSAAAEQRPLVLIVDDAHWIDEASAGALGFVARRIGAEPVGLLLAVRPEEPGGVDLTGIEQLALAGLGRDAAATLLARATGDTVAGDRVERMLAATGGNPLALLEAPELPPGDDLAVSDPPPIGPRVEAGFRGRLEALPPPTRRVLLLVAAAGDEGLDTLAAAAPALDCALGDLAPAERDGLVALAPDRVRFRHPLVRAAAYQSAPAPDRRAAHRALAAHSGGARRAGHLWAAASGPDPAAAAALEEAAAEARARAGFAAAGLAMERAARLTPDARQRAGRLAQAAQDRLLGGDAERAAALAAEALPAIEDPLARADLEALLGGLEMLAGSLAAAHERLRTAAERVAPLDVGRAARMLTGAALPYFMAGRIPVAVATAARGAELGRAGGGSAGAVAVLVDAAAGIISGARSGSEPAERAVLDAWRDTIDETALVPGAPQVIGLTQVFAWLERYDDADAVVATISAMADAAGAPGALPMLMAGLADVEARRGAFAEARARAHEAIRLTEDTGQVVQKMFPLVILARVEAALGLEAGCRAHLDEAAALAGPAGMRSIFAYRAAALGLLELGRGQAAAAVGHLQEAARLCAEYGANDPSVVPWRPDLVEALVRAGDERRAREEQAALVAEAERVARPWLTAAAARCAGLMDPDVDAAFARAHELHAAVPSRFERGRTELCHGERLRRARRPADAREPLRAALADFEALGAAPWAARARAELRAAGGAVPPAHEPLSRRLTAQELEVALLVARGATNREAGATLFVSPKTIEAHLGRIFRKLELRSRTELAALVAELG